MQTQDINAVLSSIETAHGLPNGMYINETMAQKEREHVFHKNWTALTCGKMSLMRAVLCRLICLVFPCLLRAIKTVRLRFLRMFAGIAV